MSKVDNTLAHLQNLCQELKVKDIDKPKRKRRKNRVRRLGLSSMFKSSSANTKTNKGHFWNKDNFILMLCGQPGGGKTTTIRCMLRDPSKKLDSKLALAYQNINGVLFRKFHWVFFFGPTMLAEVPMKYGENYWPVFDIKIVEKILGWVSDHIENGEVQSYGTKSDADKYKILFVLDDQGNNIRSSMAKLSELWELRRHLCGDNVMLSLIFTTQKYEGAYPPRLRDAVTDIVLYSVTKEAFEGAIGKRICNKGDARKLWEKMASIWKIDARVPLYFPLHSDYGLLSWEYIISI